MPAEPDPHERVQGPPRAPIALVEPEPHERVRGPLHAQNAGETRPAAAGPGFAARPQRRTKDPELSLAPFS